MIYKTVVKKKSGNIYYPLKEEESYMVETSKIEDAHLLPRYIQTFTNDLQQVLNEVGKKELVM